MSQNTTTTGGLSNNFGQSSGSSTASIGPSDTLSGDLLGQLGSMGLNTLNSQQYGTTPWTLDPNIAAGLNAQATNANYLQGQSLFPYTALQNMVNTPFESPNSGDFYNARVLTNNVNFDPIAQWAQSAYTPAENQATSTYQSALNPLTAENNLSSLASNTSGALTPTQNAILDQNAERISNRLASLYSGSGTYGSAGAGLGMARGIAETNNPLIAQFNQQAIQNALGANAQMSQAALARMGIQNTATGLSGSLASAQGGQMLAAQQGKLQQGQAMMQNALNYRNQQLQELGMMPQAMQASMIPGQTLQNIGSTNVSYPWEIMRNMSGVMAPLSGLIPRTMTQNNTSQNFGMGNTSGTTSTPTPWTTFAGLGIAGLGLLSDREDKTDVKRLGTHHGTGLPMYAYRYKTDPKSYPKTVGPMAQDVAKKFPHMVTRMGSHMVMRAGVPRSAGIRPPSLPWHGLNIGGTRG